MSNTCTYVPGDFLCTALAGRYPGLKFLEVWIQVASDDELADGEDLVQQITWRISGSGADLERHGFADPSWWARIPPSGEGRDAVTEGLGSAWRVWRNKKGYRLDSAHYDDGLERIAAVMVPALLPWRGDRDREPMSA